MSTQSRKCQVSQAGDLLSRWFFLSECICPRKVQTEWYELRNLDSLTKQLFYSGLWVGCLEHLVSQWITFLLTLFLSRGNGILYLLRISQRQKCYERFLKQWMKFQFSRSFFLSRDWFILVDELNDFRHQLHQTHHHINSLRIHITCWFLCRHWIMLRVFDHEFELWAR